MTNAFFPGSFNPTSRVWHTAARLLCALLLVAPWSLTAQSTTKGAIEGVVVSDGSPVWEARVILIDTQTGVRRTVETSIDGRFAFQLLPPSDYEIRVEKIPYGPVRVVVPVLPRRGVVLPPVQLEIVELPVDEFGTVPFASGAVDAARIGNSRRVAGSLVRDGAARSFTVEDLTRLISADLGPAGLASAHHGYVVEGVPVEDARMPGLVDQRTTAGWIPDGLLSGMEYVFNPVDVELPGSAGGWFVGYPRRGGRDVAFEAEADFTGAPLTVTNRFDPASFSSIRGQMLLSGPLVRDTSHFAVGLQFEQISTPFPPAWRNRSIDTRLVSVATDSFGVDLGAYAGSYKQETQRISGFGRVDAQLGDGTLATITAGVGVVREADPLLGPGHVPSLGATYEGFDVTTIGTIASGQVGGLRQEFRAGFSFGRREYQTGTSFATTRLGNNFVRFGLDESLPGRTSRSRFFLSETLFTSAGAHTLKLGFGGSIGATRQTTGYGRAGSFLFSGIDQWEAATGSFWQSVGGSSETTVNHRAVFVYVQDAWTPSERAQITFGVRMDRGNVPASDIPVNQDWASRTGILNNGTVLTTDSLGALAPRAVSGKFNFSPRFGVAYELGPEKEWVVNGAVGVFIGDVDPTMFHDLIGRSGAYEIRRGIGSFTGWPSAPDSASAPVLGPSLAVLNSEYETPRTFRASVGLARDLGSRSAIYASFLYRHTDFLPRLHDLNRPTGAASLDQYDRPVWGQLVQNGPGLVVDPGSNRRFTGFDYVTAIDPDGYSDHVSLTVGLERQIGTGVRFHAQYTYSETTDNRPLGGTIEEQLTPFPDSLNGRDWQEGTSDLDIPHRANLAMVISPNGLPVTLSGLYRFSSGRPFTPGFPDGVDANGDGSGFNDPAFVDAGANGIGPLLSRSCLSTQSGQFAARNSCRMADRHAFDARVVLHLRRDGGLPIALTVDALNILDASDGVPDRALYRIDGSGTTTTTGGVTTVPLVVNQNFGRLLYQTGGGRALRVGVRLGS